MLKVTLLTKTVGKYKNVYISNSTKAGRCEELKQRKKKVVDKVAGMC